MLTRLTAPNLFAATFLAAVLFGVLCPRHLQATQGEDPEVLAKVKSAFVLNFIRYTRWDDTAFADADSPIVIVVLGEDPLGEILDATVAEQEVHGRRIQVVRHPAPTPGTGQGEDDRTQAQELITSSHLVYYAGDAQATRQWLGQITAQGQVLTVGENEAATDDGMMFGFTLDQRRIGFFANFEQIEAAALEVNPRLLNLAKNDP